MIQSIKKKKLKQWNKSMDSFLCRGEILPKQSDLDVPDADSPHWRAEPIQTLCAQCSGVTRVEKLQLLAGLPGWSAGLALFLTTGNGEALEWGCSFPGRLSAALKLLIYYCQQHIQSRLEGHTAMTSFFFYLCLSIFVFKDLFTPYAGCSPGLEHMPDLT